MLYMFVAFKISNTPKFSEIHFNYNFQMLTHGKLVYKFKEEVLGGTTAEDLLLMKQQL
jgi:hypothetical protein